MNMKLGLSGMVAGALLYAGSALAGPAVTVNGVTVPIGSQPGGYVFESGIVDETAVGAVNDILSGVGRVDAIQDPSNNVVWQNGNNSTELAFSFTGFKVDSINSSKVTFTGGTVSFYTLPANTNFATGGSVPADTAIVQAGTPWLTLAAAPGNASLETLISTLVSGDFTTSTFIGHGDGFFDVTGGPAAFLFQKGTFSNPSDPAGASDLSFTSDFSTGACPTGITVCGSATIKANTIASPEPATIGLFGAGLAALGMARRRKDRG